MMFFFIRNTEDGLRITQRINGQAEVDALMLENESLKKESRHVFIDTVPDEYTNTNEVCIVEGLIKLPVPVKTVTSYKL